MPDSVRHNQKFVDSMHKLHSEIERNVYAAEIQCDASSRPKRMFEEEGWCNGCAFDCGCVCALPRLRNMIGNPVTQHDTENQ